MGLIDSDNSGRVRFCINRTNNAELSEALSSMYRWYKDAKVCIAYLDDVRSDHIGDNTADFRESEWFTRGWTLQELVAPQELLFYNSTWQRLGELREVCETVATVTRIPSEILNGNHQPWRYSIAQRMSWAAFRQTSRAEDTAYCLMGLFNIYMPLLYGEGAYRAFIRLQEEIIKDSSDQTIFASNLRPRSGYEGLFAQSPADFAGCEETVQSFVSEAPVSFHKSNIGLKITLKVRHYEMDILHAALEAGSPSSSGSSEQVGIFLGCPAFTRPANSHGRQLVSGSQSQLPFRAQEYPEKCFEMDLIIPNIPFEGVRPSKALFGFVLGLIDIGGFTIDSTDLSNRIEVITRPSTWNPETNTVTLEPGTAGAAFSLALRDESQNAWIFLKLGFYSNFAPWTWVLGPDYRTSMLKSPKHIGDLIGSASERYGRGNKDLPSGYHDPSSGEDVLKIQSEEILDVSVPSPELRFEGYHYGRRDSGLSFENAYIRLKIWRSQARKDPWTVRIDSI